MSIKIRSGKISDYYFQKTLIQLKEIIEKLSGLKLVITRRGPYYEVMLGSILITKALGKNKLLYELNQYAYHLQHQSTLDSFGRW